MHGYTCEDRSAYIDISRIAFFNMRVDYLKIKGPALCKKLDAESRFDKGSASSIGSVNCKNYYDKRTNFEVSVHWSRSVTWFVVHVDYYKVGVRKMSDYLKYENKCAQKLFDYFNALSEKIGLGIKLKLVEKPP